MDTPIQSRWELRKLTPPPPGFKQEIIEIGVVEMNLLTLQITREWSRFIGFSVKAQEPQVLMFRTEFPRILRFTDSPFPRPETGPREQTIAAVHGLLAGNLGRQLKARVTALRVGRERHGQHCDVVILPKAAGRVHNLVNCWLGLHQR